MTTYTVAQGTRSSSILNLGTLASATYVASSAQDLTATIPEDVVIEVDTKFMRTVYNILAADGPRERLVLHLFPHSRRLEFGQRF